tara:strand:+ start:999 stop:1826 length:828 start_codon:yes stop_codon:yes gene_type:complete
MASNAVELANLVAGDTFIVDTSTSRVGIASTVPSQALAVTGNVRSSGIVSATSLIGDVTGNLTGDVSGNITGTTATFSGNVTIGGTLTYEDVNSIDSIGIVTARDGIRIGTGGTVGPAGVGVVTYFGDGSQLDGVAITLTNDTSTDATYYPILSTGISGDLSAVKVSNTKLTFNPSSGQLNATDINSSSDINLKENISRVENAGEVLSNLTGVNFTWKETQRDSIGVIAQELEEILPQLVSDTENGKSVNYNGLIGVLIEAVKELSDRVDQLENK